jgi:hypothetical protein
MKPAQLYLTQEAQALSQAAQSIQCLRLNNDELFRDIHHCFDVHQNEIGYIAFPYTPVERVVTFDPPRRWSYATLDRLETAA